MSKSLFLSPDTKDEYWYNCAKDVFRAGLVYLKLNNKTSNKDLWEFFSQSVELMLAGLNTLPLGERGALKHIDKADSPASSTIISLLQERIGFFRYMVDIDGISVLGSSYEIKVVSKGTFKRSPICSY